MSQGKIVQIIGAVVDVEFNRNEVPKVYDALKVENTEITLEVQQQLGDGIVRCIALGSTDGLKRNLVATNTGHAISVPVGTGTLGRIILDKPETVRIFGEEHPVRARIERISGFSAHADQNELYKWISSIKEPPRMVFITHGERNEDAVSF